MSLALALKYRPTTFDDLIGQEAISQTLSMALDSDRLSHAYLFSGLRGSGKTSTARIFARALLCEKGPSSHPCGECAHCKMALQNRHMDIIEMDAASNRGIDDIKELIEHTRYKPSSARYKIFIIDEVHMLTNQAFNALLKTLEEPPSFVKFVLATTDPLKLPATILSRTQHFRFKKISQNLVTKHIEKILNLEKIEFDPKAIEIVARSGAGSLRDSLTLLDQAIVYSKNFVDLTTVTSMLGIIEFSKLDDLIDKIIKKDTNAIISFINEAKEYESEMVLDELTMLLKSKLLELDHAMPPLILERFFRIIAEAKSLLSIGSDGEFVLSLTLMKMMESLEILEIDALISKLKKDVEEGSSKVEQNSKKQEVVKITEDEITPQTIESSQPQERKNDGFEELIKRLYDRNYELGKLFDEHIDFVSFEDGKLTWISSVDDEQRKRLIDAWGIVKMFVQEIFGVDTKIENIAKKKVAKPAHKQNNEEGRQDLSSAQEQHPAGSCVAPAGGESEASKEKDPSAILDEPMVKSALEMLDPHRVTVKRKS